MDADPNAKLDDASEREQLTLLWMQAQSAIAAFIRVGVRDQQHAEDLLQETALAVARSFDKFDTGRPFLPWVMAIAKNKIIDYYKTTGKDRLTFSPELIEKFSTDFDEGSTADHEYMESLQRCMDRLSKSPQIAIELRYVRSMSYAQIGERIGRSSAGVANLLLRTRTALLQCIQARLEARGQS